MPSWISSGNLAVKSNTESTWDAPVSVSVLVTNIVCADTTPPAMSPEYACCGDTLTLLVGWLQIMFCKMDEVKFHLNFHLFCNRFLLPRSQLSWLILFCGTRFILGVFQGRAARNAVNSFFFIAPASVQTERLYNCNASRLFQEHEVGCKKINKNVRDGK